MLDDFFTAGKSVTLPEVAAYLPEAGTDFLVLGINVGGMGACVHLKQELSGKEFALKFMRPELFGDSKFFVRFKDELQVWLKASECDGVAEAISVIRINQMPCVLATWLGGGDLRNAMPDLDPQQKFKILLRTVLSLDWVHKNLNVIHRDIKPSNILLDGQGISYVTDWGLARPVRQLFSEIYAGASPININRADRTEAGTFVGTLMYAAPEQIKSARDVDHRADIYALGCLMYELETGKPPFVELNQQKLIEKHLYTPPPRLGSILKRTQLGIEKIAAKCLEKNPDSRFSNYQVLTEALRKIADKKGFDLSDVHIEKRYSRTIIGEGKRKQKKIIREKGIFSKNGDYAIVEFDELRDIFEEANNLISLCRYEDAAEILKPHYRPEVINYFQDDWVPFHTIALNYALCLENIDGKLQSALDIYNQLNMLASKPAEFYVNMSNCLNKANHFKLAKDICKEGLALYQDDVCILGNYTISLKNLGDIEGAKDSAIKRLGIRRDVSAIEEAICVLADYRKGKRAVDLPEAINIAKQEHDLICEGLTINPAHSIYYLQKVDLFRFANDNATAAELCKNIVNDQVSHQLIKQSAFYIMMEILADVKSYDLVLERVDTFYEKMTDERLRSRLLLLKNSILADHYMIGKQTQKGERVIIKDVVDFFLETNDGYHIQPVMAAKVLEWLGDTERALKIIHDHLSNHPGDWEAVKNLALFLLRQSDYDEAFNTGHQLIKIAPWRAESYDWLSYVAEQVGDSKSASTYKNMGDKVFEKEKSLFEELRVYLEGH